MIYLILKIFSVLIILLLISAAINTVYIRYESKTFPSISKIIHVTLENAFSLLQGEMMLHPTTSTGKFILLIYADIGFIFLALIISSIRTTIDPNTMEDSNIYSYIKDKHIIVRKGSKAETLVKKFKGIPYSVAFKQSSKNYSYNDLLDKFLENPDKYNGVAGDIPYIKYTINKGGGKYNDLKIHEDLLAINTFAFPIRKNHKLLEKIDTELIKNKDDRIHQLIVSKYLGPDLSIQANF